MERYECIENSANKFWEVDVSDRELTIRFGPIGALGSQKKKLFATSAEAVAAKDKLVREKLAKGYKYVNSPTNKVETGFYGRSYVHERDDKDVEYFSKRDDIDYLVTKRNSSWDDALNERIDQDLLRIIKTDCGRFSNAQLISIFSRFGSTSKVYMEVKTALMKRSLGVDEVVELMSAWASRKDRLDIFESFLKNQKPSIKTLKLFFNSKKNQASWSVLSPALTLVKRVFGAKAYKEVKAARQ